MSKRVFLSVAFAAGSRNRLTEHDLDRFPGDTLFDRVGRTICHAGCLPRKELYEAWEVARRVRRLRRGGRVIDAAGGAGLLAHLMILLDDPVLKEGLEGRPTADTGRSLRACGQATVLDVSP